MKTFIIGLVFGVILIYVLFEIRNRCYVSQSLNRVIQVLSRQAARWTTAAEQDENPMIAVLHANYGAGYLWALKDIASDQQINIATGIDMKQFISHIVTVQDKVTKRMAKLCPDFAPPSTYLTKIGGEGFKNF